MKLKGINPLEQYVEKIVLAVVALALLAAVAVQFLVTPNNVEVTGGRSIAPDDVLEVLGDQADTLLGQVNDPNPELPEFETPALASILEDGLSRAGDGRIIDRAAAFAALGEGVQIDIGGEVAAQGPVMALSLPTPVEPTAAGYWVTVDPYFADAHPNVKKYVPEIQPLDMPGVSVQASVEIEPLVESLRATEEGRRPIPRGWWSAGIEVLEVQAERQRLQPDGSWSPAEPVARPLWLPDPLEIVRSGSSDPAAGDPGTSQLTRNELGAYVELARNTPQLTARPPYVRSIAGLPWVPPADVSRRNEQILARDEARRIEDQIAELSDRIADLQGRQGGATQPTTRPNRNTGRGNRPVVGPTITSGPGSTPQRDPNRTDSVGRQVERLQNQIDELEQQLAELDLDDDLFQRQTQARLPSASRPPAGGQGGSRGIIRPTIDPAPFPRTAPGGRGIVRPTIDDPGTSRDPRDPRGGRRTPATAPSGRPGAGPGMLSMERAEVWTHDLDVVPGAQYRYRVRVGVNNPLYQRGQLLGTEDAEMLRQAEQAIAFTPWTDWTEPIEVDRKSYYFVTAASDRGQLGLSTASATVELYQMYYGYYRRATESVEPGDPLQARFRLPDSLVTFDTAVMQPAEVAEFLTGGEARRIVTPTTDPRSPTRGAADDDVQEELEPPAGVSRVETRLPLGLEAVLMDVAGRPDSDDPDRLVVRRVTEVFFFDPLEGIVVRVPDRDTGAERYRRVSMSAEAGESAEIFPPEPEQQP